MKPLRIASLTALLLASECLSSDLGKWAITQSTSPMDDSSVITLALDAEAPIATRHQTSTPRLVIRCQSRKVAALFDWGVFITTGTPELTVRFGKGKPATDRQNISTDHRSVFVRSPLGYIESAMAVDTLLVRVTPHGEDPVLATFDVRGLSNAIGPLRAACPW